MGEGGLLLRALLRVMTGWRGRAGRAIWCWCLVHGLGLQHPHAAGVCSAQEPGVRLETLCAAAKQSSAARSALQAPRLIQRCLGSLQAWFSLACSLPAPAPASSCSSRAPREPAAEDRAEQGFTSPARCEQQSPVLSGALPVPCPSDERSGQGRCWLGAAVSSSSIRSRELSAASSPCSLRALLWLCRDGSSPGCSLELALPFQLGRALEPRGCFHDSGAGAFL